MSNMSNDNLNEQMKVGGIEEKIPEGLLEIFPYETFLYPWMLPGVYVIYFPDFNKVYIGESPNVKKKKKRLSRQTKDFSVSANIPLNLYLQKRNFNSKTYALYQGPNCTRKVRRILENKYNKYIKQSGKNSINIASNANQVYNDITKSPKKYKLYFLPMKTHESWLYFNLPYVKNKYLKKSSIF